MKKLLIYFVTVFVLFGCSNTKKGVVCKNEVKTHKYKGFNEPYSYQKINSNKIDKIHAQNKTHKLEKEVEYLEEPSYASIDKDHFIVSKDPIKERIRNHKNTTFFTPEPEATAPKTNGLAVAGFVTWLFGFFLSFAGIPFVGFIGAMMAAMSLFQITNNKGKYKGAGWGFCSNCLASLLDVINWSIIYCGRVSCVFNTFFWTLCRLNCSNWSTLCSKFSIFHIFSC